MLGKKVSETISDSGWGLEASGGRFTYLLRVSWARWPAGGADADEAAGFGLDHGAKIVPAPCVLLLKIGSRTGSGSLIWLLEVNLAPFRRTYPRLVGWPNISPRL
ncbi:hypothetical protein GCM10028797_13440 [Dyella agri]